MLHGILYSLVLANIRKEIILYPLPIKVPAYYLGGLCLGIDLLFFNVAGLGGAGAGYQMFKHLI